MSIPKCKCQIKRLTNGDFWVTNQCHRSYKGHRKPRIAFQRDCVICRGYGITFDELTVQDIEKAREEIRP